MRSTVRLLQACRITLFTRANCSLCTDAKVTLSKVWDVRHFVYREVDVMAADQEAWKDLYEFDTPVVSIRLAAHLFGGLPLTGLMNARYT